MFDDDDEVGRLEWGNCDDTPVIQDEDPFAYEDDDDQLKRVLMFSG